MSLITFLVICFWLGGVRAYRDKGVGWFDALLWPWDAGYRLALMGLT